MTSEMVPPLTVPTVGPAIVEVQNGEGSKRTALMLDTSTPSPTIVNWGAVLVDRKETGENEVDDARIREKMLIKKEAKNKEKRALASYLQTVVQNRCWYMHRMHCWPQDQCTPSKIQVARHSLG